MNKTELIKICMAGEVGHDVIKLAGELYAGCIVASHQDSVEEEDLRALAKESLFASAIYYDVVADILTGEESPAFKEFRETCKSKQKEGPNNGPETSV